MADEELREDRNRARVQGALTPANEIRNVRVTDEGNPVAGHRHVLDDLLRAPVDTIGTTVLVDVSEEGMTLIAIKNGMNEVLNIEISGILTNLEDVLVPSFALASGSIHLETVTDAWSQIKLALTGPITPTGSDVVVEAGRRT